MRRVPVFFSYTPESCSQFHGTTQSKIRHICSDVSESRRKTGEHVTISTSTRYAVLTLVFALFSGAFSVAIAAPEAGMFLVATRKIDGTSFERTVILLTQYDKSGAMGLAINRSSNRPMSQFFPELGPPSRSPLFLGGPVHPTALFVLARPKEATEGRPVLGDIQMFAGQAALEYLKKRYEANDNEDLRAYSGYTGWGAGQLDAELTRGDWVLVKFEPKIVFDNNLPEIWEVLHRIGTATWI